MKWLKVAMFIVGGALVGAARAFPEFSHVLDAAGVGLMALPAKLEVLLPGAKS